MALSLEGGFQHVSLKDNKGLSTVAPQISPKLSTWVFFLLKCHGNRASKEKKITQASDELYYTIHRPLIKAGCWTSFKVPTHYFIVFSPSKVLYRVYFM